MVTAGDVDSAIHPTPAWIGTSERGGCLVYVSIRCNPVAPRQILGSLKHDGFHKTEISFV